MFDNLNQQRSSVQPEQKIINPVNMSAKAEDIFAETEPISAKPVQFQSINTDASGHLEPAPHNGDVQKVFFLLIAVVGFAFLGTGGYFGYKYLSKSKVVIQNDAVLQTVPAINQAASVPAASSSNAEVVNSTPASSVVSSQNVDTDKDGLSDDEEMALGLSLEKTDTDGDGLFDREEVKIYKTNPKNSDTDNDGMSDGDEVDIKRNPNGEGDLFNVNSTSTVSTSSTPLTNSATNPVSANGGLNGAITSSSQPIVDVFLDSDRDGLTDVNEINQYKTNPHISDTDGDGYSDGVEVSGGHDPLVGKIGVSNNIDSDQDGLTDTAEKLYKTDPLNSDTDNDGYSDGAEVGGGFNPNGTGKLVL